jgi:threonine dehydratase
MTMTASKWFNQVRDARRRLAGQAHETPVMTSRTLDDRCGANVFLKCENFQKIGAFKFRGAFNAMSRLSAEQRRRGVVTHSSGNHAQAVALVGRMLNIDTTVVMPENAPAIKRNATAGYGARIVAYDPQKASREAITAELTARHGLTLIPPFDHEDVIAGQGTAALELFSQVGGLDLLVVPCGGGGLICGCAIAAKSIQAGCRVIGVEPEAGDDATRSFKTGRLHTVHNPNTIADGTRTASLGTLTFPLLLETVDDMVTVTEEEIAHAVAFLFYRTKLVVEPSGALGVAAILAGRLPSASRVGVVISGGNIDGSVMHQILQEQGQTV